MWSHDVIARSVDLASDLKVGQYLKIPPQVMFLAQLWGTIIGVYHQRMRKTPLLTVGTGVVINYGKFSHISVYRYRFIQSHVYSRNGVSRNLTTRRPPQPNRNKCMEWPSDSIVEQRCNNMVAC